MTSVPSTSSGGFSFPVDQPPQRTLIALPLVLLGVAAISVALRIYSRRLKKAGLGADDFLSILALILACAGQATIIVMVVKGGAGLPLMDETPDTFVTYTKTLIANYLIWQAAVCSIQCSILLFYVRLFGISRPFRLACHVGIGLSSAWFIAAFIVVLAGCNPIYKAWEPTVPGTCIDETAACTGFGISHVIFDFFILTLPLPLIWNLQTKRSNKVLISGILGLGVFGTLCSILRMECIITLIDADPLKIATQWLALLFQSMEVPVAIICTCIPTLGPVGQQIRSSSLGISLRSLIYRTSRSFTSGSGSSSRKPHGPLGERRNCDFERLDQSSDFAGARKLGKVDASAEAVPMETFATPAVGETARGGQLGIVKTREWEVRRH